jgi:hypothetical protein
MQVSTNTDEIRNEIATSIPKLTLKQAAAIAEACNVSQDTVYRNLRIIRGREAGVLNEDVLLCFAELAIENRKAQKKQAKKKARILRQLSASQAA